MKTNIILSILLFSFINLNAQKAIPDFTVSDIYGNKHQLYSDYLDNGKFVFIDFFTTTCPSCNTLAPIVDTVFRDFGCNYGDVVFLAIDKYHSDNDVWEFTEQYTMTFPSISGEDGGGNLVHNDYDIPYTPYKLIISNNYEIVSENPYQFDETAEKLRDTLLTFGLKQQLCQGNDFMFYSLISDNDSIVGTISKDKNSIELNFPAGTDLTSLTANFRNAPNSSVQINEVDQISGVTENDFTLPVVYQITSETGVLENWTVNVSTSVNLKNLSDKFNIYPNPSSGIFIIENKYGNTKAIISNITGKKIKTIILEDKDAVINLSNYSKGIYFINIETNKGLITRKLVLY